MSLQIVISDDVQSGARVSSPTVESWLNDWADFEAYWLAVGHKISEDPSKAQK